MYDLITVGGITRDIFILNPLATSQGISARARAKQPYFTFAYGQKIDVESFFALGGGAANVAVGAARLGLKTAATGKVGLDQEGQDVVKRFRQFKVIPDFISKDRKQHTGFSIILSSRQGERSVLLYRGANNYLKPEDVPWSKLKQTKWLFVSHLSGQSHRLVKRLAGFARRNPKINIAWNPGSTQIKAGSAALKPLLKHTQVLILNKEEAESLSRYKNRLYSAAGMKPVFEKLESFGPSLVVITDGKKGARFYFKNHSYFIPALSAKGGVVNTLGAGDAFSAGLLAGLVKYGQEDSIKAMLWAALNGAAVTEKIGAQQGLLSLSTLLARLRKLPADVVKVSRVRKDGRAAKSLPRPLQKLRVPIEVSARHVHLASRDLRILFGPGYGLKPVRVLSQPEEFASSALVSLAGPKGKIDRVRVLGPVRPKTQVETSRTEAIQLGLTPPLRLSGRLANAGLITIIGPKGRIKRKAHIVAQRHLHISTAKAKVFGLKNNQKISVDTTGRRGLIFENVVVRAHPAYRLACHLDTDEADAAGLSRGGQGKIIAN